jgi:hypothetical protein
MINCFTRFRYFLIVQIFLIAFFIALTAGATTFRVFFKDKGQEQFFPGSPLYQQTEQLHNKRCIKRRLKVRIPDSLFTIEDAPVSNQYIQTISDLGITVKLKLRWRNYIVVDCDSVQSESLKLLDFVRAVQPTTSKANLLKIDSVVPFPSILDYLLNSPQANCGIMQYGLSLNQAAMLDVPPLHELGITGQNAVIGFLDSGFRWRQHIATANASIIAEWDFIQSDSITYNQDGDRYDQDNHGMEVFSTVAGYYPDKLIGIAPGASFLLAKTENVSSETHIEEDNYAAGMEWLESMGADIVSSSLGYFTFDSTDVSYTYADLDGKTTIVSRAVNAAASRGVICVTAAGNEGPADMTIIAPADADSVLAVAAVYPDGTTAGFSSRGPRVDGAIKPNIAAQGVSVVAAAPYDSTSIVGSAGTSLSTPLIAGSLGLIVSTFPELSPYKVKQLLLQTGTQSTIPDNVLGWGIPDVYKAILNGGIVISPAAIYMEGEYQRCVVNILSKYPLLNAYIYISTDDGSNFQKFELSGTSKSVIQFYADIPMSFIGNASHVNYYIFAESGSEQRRMPPGQDETYIFKPGTTEIPCGVDQSLLPYISADAKDVFVYPTIIPQGTPTVGLNVHLRHGYAVNVDIYNSAGQRVDTHQYSYRSEGYAWYPLDISHIMSTGSYFIRVNFENKFEVVPVVFIR